MAAMLKASPPVAGIAFHLSGKARLAQRPTPSRRTTPQTQRIRLRVTFILLDEMEALCAWSSIRKRNLIRVAERFHEFPNPTSLASAVRLLRNHGPGFAAQTGFRVDRGVEKQGGALQYQTEVDRGTTFGIVLSQVEKGADEGASENPTH